MAVKRTTTEYTADNMKALTGLDPIRQNPSQYIGDTSAVAVKYLKNETPEGEVLTAGGMHLFVETLSNSSDEGSNYDKDGNVFANFIEVILHADQSITVKDNGRGVPPDINKTTGKTGIEMCWLTMNSGGKFKSKTAKGGGNYSGGAAGLHGQGAACVAALSDFLNVKVYRGGYEYEMNAKRGIPGTFDEKGKFAKNDGTKDVVTKVKDPRPKKEQEQFPHGTYVTWHPDPLMWGGTDIPLAEVYAHVAAQSYMAPDCTYHIIDEIQKKDITYHHPGGIADMIEEKTSKGVNISPIIAFDVPAKYIKKVTSEDESGNNVTQDMDYDCEVQVAMRWTGRTGADLEGYANGVHCLGRHVDGLRRGLSRGVGDWIKTAGIMTKKDEKDGISPTIEDITDGLVAVIEVRLEEQCYFTSQTKEILNNAEVLSCVSDTVKEEIGKWFTTKKNAAAAKKIGKSVIESAKLRAKQKKERETAKKVKEFERNTSWPEKLTNCSEYDDPRAELIIVEGDSAANPCRAMRDSRFQAIFPIRGKILNTFDLPLQGEGRKKGVLDNVEAASILKIHSHYHNIIILSDADPDGAHIETLVYTLFYKHMPEVVEEGRIFAVDAPLFVIETLDNQTFLAKNDKEKDEIVAKLKKEGKKVKTPISRLKGWGECPPELVEQTCLNPNTRVLRRLNIEDMERAEKTLGLAMGNDVEPRKEWLIEQLGYGKVRLFS